MCEQKAHRTTGRFTSGDVVAVSIHTKHDVALIVSAYNIRSTDSQVAKGEQLW